MCNTSRKNDRQSASEDHKPIGASAAEMEKLSWNHTRDKMIHTKGANCGADRHARKLFFSAIGENRWAYAP